MANAIMPSMIMIISGALSSRYITHSALFSGAPFPRFLNNNLSESDKVIMAQMSYTVLVVVVVAAVVVF